MTPILVDEVLRPMPGGSRSLLVRSADSLYIVKCPYNQQGPNVLANEFLGTQLMDALGLPTPSWQLAQFRAHSDCHQCAERGLLAGQRPLHFASAMIPSMPGTQVYASIPRSHFSRVENRIDFLRAFVFDIWGGAIDQRQAVFLKNNHTNTYRASFIDHGHLFGGPRWNSRSRRGIALSRDSAIYEGIVNADRIEDIICQMTMVIPTALPEILASLPSEWRCSGAFWLEEALLLRLYTLRNQVLEEIGTLFARSTHLSEFESCV